MSYKMKNGHKSIQSYFAQCLKSQIGELMTTSYFQRVQQWIVLS